MALRLWLGFPKSLDISKAIDKKLGAEREIVEKRRFGGRSGDSPTAGASNGGVQGGFNLKDNRDITSPATPEAQEWEGWGTALKPANEPIVLARKPLSEKTIVENVMKWGTGGLNIDGCRIGTEQIKTHGKRQGKGVSLEWSKYTSPEGYEGGIHQGRFPANVILDEEAGRMLDEQQGGASRFFYVAKASQSERTHGGKVENNHVTVKPLKLMRYLCRLIAPPGGLILDPFAGSGTTLIAAVEEGFSVIGIEREPEYCEIIRKRMAEVQPALPLVR
jgi:hypothetical protein